MYVLVAKFAQHVYHDGYDSIFSFVESHLGGAQIKHYHFGGGLFLDWMFVFHG